MNWPKLYFGCLKRNLSFQISFCDARCEIPFSSAFHNAEKRWLLINWFDDSTQITDNGWCEWVTRVWDRVGSTNSRFRPAQTQHWQWCFCANISYLAHKLLNTSVPSPSDHDAKPTPWEETTKVPVSPWQHQKLSSPLNAMCGSSSPTLWHEPVQKWLVLGNKAEFSFHCTSLKGC